MKKALLLLLIVPMAFMGCKKDEAKNEEATIVGKWTEKSFAYEYYNSSNVKVFSETDPGTKTWEFNQTPVS